MQAHGSAGTGVIPPGRDQHRNHQSSPVPPTTPPPLWALRHPHVPNRPPQRTLRPCTSEWSPGWCVVSQELCLTSLPSASLATMPPPPPPELRTDSIHMDYVRPVSLLSGVGRSPSTPRGRTSAVELTQTTRRRPLPANQQRTHVRALHYASWLTPKCACGVRCCAAAVEIGRLPARTDPKHRAACTFSSWTDRRGAKRALSGQSTPSCIGCCRKTRASAHARQPRAHCSRARKRNPARAGACGSGALT